MPIDGPYEPSPWPPVAEQVALYEPSGGTEGTLMEGAPCVILWTKGRKTGTVRKTPLMRVAEGDRYAVVASMGGAPDHPVWFHNVVADPAVSLQDGPALRDYTAHVATPEEKAEWWPGGTAVWPAFDDYQAATDRDIPVIVLESR